jgi:hypothetical protein
VRGDLHIGGPGEFACRAAGELHVDALGAIVLAVTRSREPGENPGLTRNGMGSLPSWGRPGLSPNTRRLTPNIRTLFSRTDG